MPKEDYITTGFPTPGACIPTNMLSYRGVYQRGAEEQRISGPIAVVSSIAEYPSDNPLFGLEIIGATLWFGDYAMQLMWFSETMTMSIPWPPWEGFNVPAATILVRDVKLL